MADIRKIEHHKAPAPKKKKKVAAYARVSMASEQLEHSLAAQISHYNELIQSTPGWQFAGVYSDDGITGTSTSKRKGFRQMVEDADAGKIDIILTKSISRFARNTLDLLQTVRHLKGIGVSVRFEREHIDSMTADGELMLTILASFAEEESKSIGSNVKWGIRKRFEKGEGFQHHRMLGYEWDGEKYQIIPEEAEEVKQIFKAYLEGKTSIQIAAMGFTGINGTPLTYDAVLDILDNEDYTGDLILQKRYATSSTTSRKNNGELPKFMIHDDHEAIVSREDFEEVRRMREEKRERLVAKRDAPTIFQGKVFCGRCGNSCNRRSRSGQKIWYCRTTEREGKTVCPGFPVKESELLKAMEQLGITEFERILIFDERVEFYSAGRKNPFIWKKLSPHSRFRSKVYCGECGCACERVRGNGSKKEWFHWSCTRKGCNSATIWEKELDKAADYFFPGESFRYDCDRALLYSDRIEFLTKEGRKIWQRT